MNKQQYIIISLGVIIASIIILQLVSEADIILTKHDPIIISGNDGFTGDSGISSGKGTKEDPYVIEKLEISARNTDLISISNTSKYLVLKNMKFNNGTSGLSINNALNIYFLHH